MESGKLIENVIVISGISAMAYLLLKNKKPTNQVSQPIYTAENGSPLAKDTFHFKGKPLSSICYKTEGGTKVASIDRVYFTQKDLPYIKELCDNLPNTLKNEFDQPLFATDYQGGVSLNSCSEVNNRISVLNSYIEQQILKLPVIETNRYVAQKKYLEDIFNKYNCRDKIEAIRTNSLVDLQTKGSINAENSVLGKGFSEQKAYIILGALVLLTGFYVVVKK